MNCAQCGRLLYATQRKCNCGWNRPIESLPPAEQPRSSPSVAVSRAIESKLVEVNAFVEKFRIANPGATARDACLEGLRKRGLLSMLPKTVKR